MTTIEYFVILSFFKETPNIVSMYENNTYTRREREISVKLREELSTDVREIFLESKFDTRINSVHDLDSTTIACDHNASEAIFSNKIKTYVS